MAGGRPKVELILTETERETLQRWSRRPKSSQFLALRSRIILACGRGSSNTQPGFPRWIELGTDPSS